MVLLFALLRALHFASVMTLFGACAFGWLVSARLGGEPGASRRLLLWCAGAGVLSLILCVGFVANQMAGTNSAAFDPATLWQVARDTLYGRLALARLGLLSAFLLRIRLRPSAMAVAGTVFGGGALALLGLTSHAAAAGAPHLEYALAAADALHLLAAGFWIGGLVALVPAALARDRTSLVAQLRLFSSWATIAVAALVAAGTIGGFAILDVPGMRWSGAYMTWLAIKLVLAGLMIALALTNRFGLMPGLARGDVEAAQMLPLTLFAELVCAALILLAVGFLGIMAPMQM